MAVFLFVLVLSCGSATAATINVNPGANAIENAIGTANAGDTLNLSAGTYQEYDLDVNKNLTITGPFTSDEPTAVIDAQQKGRVFNIPANCNVTLQYLSIVSGDASNEPDNTWGGGIQNQGVLTIKHCRINSNTADYAGGIYNTGTCTVSDSALVFNTATNGYGGGIFNSYGICSVNDSTIYGNTADYGGGIYNLYGTCTVNDSYLWYNTATNGHGGGIYNEGTCTVSASSVNGNTATSSYYGGGGICNYAGGTCTVSGSSVNGNTADYAGGIYNIGTCTVSASSVEDNTATNDGGGIYNSGTCTVSASSVNGNTADYGGGIYNLYGTCTVSNSALYGNTSNVGGAICNYGVLTVSGCDFAYNRATGNGNAIYNEDGDLSSRIVNFNRFHDPGAGYEIYSASGSVDAMYNWWGSDVDPSGKVSGTVDVNPWLVLTITANPSLVGKDLTSTVTVDLLHDSDGVLHDVGPNAVPVIFNTDFCSITPIICTDNGIANATFTAGTANGVAHITALLDGQILRTTVTVDALAPTIVSSDPVNGATNIAADKIITVTFSENVVMGTGWIELVDSSNTAIPFTMSLTGNVLTITPTNDLTKSRYKVKLHTGCVTDLAGNMLAGKSISFSVGTSPTITATTPVNGATNVNVAKTITVTFSEAIYRSKTFWVELVDSNGAPVAFTSYITGGNILVIDPTSYLTANTTYKVKLHTGCVTDLAGNPVAPYIFSFTTRNT